MPSIRFVAPRHMSYRAGCALGLALMLSACGYKGPLYMPPPPPPAPDTSLTAPPGPDNVSLDAPAPSAAPAATISPSPAGETP